MKNQPAPTTARPQGHHARLVVPALSWFLTVVGAAFTCAVLLVAGPPAMAAERGAEQPDRITFVAYNVENYLLMPRRVDGQLVQAAPKPEPSIQHLIRIIAATAPDIIGICEIGSDQVPDLQARLAAVGIDLPHVEIVGGGDVVRELALLSRFPIVARNSQRHLTYQLDGHVLPMQRGILDATIELSGGSHLRCVGVHFKSKREIPEFDQSLMRRHEAGLLRQHLDAIFAAEPAVKLLVYGDLNDTRNEPAVRHVIGPHNRAEGLRAVHVADDRGERWTHYWETADLYSRIDYLLVSRSLWPRVDGERSYIPHDADFRQASDHRPLVLSIRVD